MCIRYMQHRYMLTLTMYQAVSIANERRNMFWCQKSWTTTNLANIPTTEATNHKQQFITNRYHYWWLLILLGRQRLYTSSIQVPLAIKMEHHIKKISISAKENNVSKGIRCTYDEKFKIMVIKPAEETSVKQHRNTMSPWLTFKRRNLRMPILHQNYSLALNKVTFIN